MFEYNDLTTASLFTGNFTMGTNGRSQVITIPIHKDSFTEGTESFALSTKVAVSPTITVNDTSLFPSVYTISINPLTANETTTPTISVKLTTTGVSNGTKIPFKMTGTGITVTDFTNAPVLTGFFEIVGATSPANLTPITTSKIYTISADKLYENTETLTVTLTSVGSLLCPLEANGKFARVLIEDTSKLTYLSKFFMSSVPLTALEIDFSDANSNYYFLSALPHPTDTDTLNNSNNGNATYILPADYIKIENFIINNSADTVTKSRGHFKGRVSQAPVLIPNVFGNTNKRGLSSTNIKHPTSGLPNFSMYALQQWSLPPTKSLTMYYVGSTQLNKRPFTLINHAGIVASPSQQRALSRLSKETTAYEFKFVQNTWKTITMPCLNMAEKFIFVISFDCVNNKFAWFGTEFNSPTEITNSDLSLSQYSTVSPTEIFYANIGYGFDLLAEHKAFWGYTNPTNLQTLVNNLKAKWNF